MPPSRLPLAPEELPPLEAPEPDPVLLLLLTAPELPPPPDDELDDEADASSSSPWLHAGQPASNVSPPRNSENAAHGCL